MRRIRSGADIRRERERLSLSREKLASLVDVSTATLRRWEIGTVEPSALVLRGIERAFLNVRVAPRRRDAVTPLLDKLILANKILIKEGLIGPFGHVSLRSTGGETFFIAKREPVDLARVRDIVEVEIDVTPESAKARNLYLEIFIHSCIYQRSPEIQAVVHTHSPYALALGTMKAPEGRILPTTNPGANLGNFIPVFPEVGLIQSRETGLKIAQALQGQNGVLLRGHGAVIVGRALEQAVLRAIYLEVEARAQVVVRSAGEPIAYSAMESDIFRNTRAVDHAWRHYSEKAQASTT